ncbi:MAG: hypothetical protein AAF598_03170, partial [Bacteroidota bacterium]
IKNLMSYQHQLDIKNILDNIYQSRASFLDQIGAFNGNEFEKADVSTSLESLAKYLEVSAYRINEIVHLIPDGGSNPGLTGLIYEETLMVSELRSLINHLRYEEE